MLEVLAIFLAAALIGGAISGEEKDTDTTVKMCVACVEVTHSTEKNPDVGPTP